MKSLKNLIYESSSLTNPIAMNIIQAEKKLFNEEEEELSEIEQVCEEQDIKEKQSESSESDVTKEQSVELKDTKESEYEDDFEEMSEKEEEESQSEDPSTTTTSKSSSTSTTKSSTTSKSTSTSKSSDSEDETDSSELSIIEQHREESTLDKDPTVSVTLCPPKTSLDEHSITADFVTVVNKIAGDQPITEVVSSEAALPVSSNDDSGKVISVKCSTNIVDDVVNQKRFELKPATMSILKMIQSESSIKKTVSFKMIVHGKFYMKNSTLKENSEDFVLALKQPEIKWKVPSRRVCKAPQRYRPVSRTPLQMPKIKHFGRLPNEDDQPEEKITAADIFGPSKDSKIFDDLPEDDDGLNGNLDDAMDFLLNM